MTSGVRAADAETATQPATAGRTGRTLLGEPMVRLVSIALGLFVLAAILVITSARRGVQVSINDEATHADYAYQIAHGRIPAKGAIIAPEILREWSCRGAWNAAATALPPCDAAVLPPSKYPAQGQDYNFGHPPLYYAITGLIARAGNAVFPGRHFITIGRMTGLGWLFAAMIVSYLAIRRFGARWQYAAVGAALISLCPGVLQATSMISNDAPAVLCGATALYLLGGLLLRGRIGWVAPVVATVLATATKVLNGLPMLILGCVLVVLAAARWRAGQRAEGRRLALSAVGIIVAFALVFKGWALFQAGRGVPGWVSPIAGVSGHPYGGNPINDLLSTSFSGFQIVSGYFLQPQINGESVSLWARLLNLLVATAPFLALVAFRSRTPPWVLGLTTLGGLLGYPLVVELQIFVESHLYFPIVTPRYGMTLIPLAIACLMLVANHRGLLRTTILTTSAGIAIMILAVSGLFSFGTPVSV